MDDFSSDINTTGVLPINGFVTGVLEDNNPDPDIDTSFDTDWFALSVVAGRSYYLNPTTNSPDINVISSRFFDATGTMVLNGSSGANEFIAEETGTVYVEVFSNNGGSGSYTLNLLEDDLSLIHI